MIPKKEKGEPIITNPFMMTEEDFQQLKEDPIIEGFFDREETIELVAPRQSGETHFALQMGLAVSCGLPFCGHETRKQKVLYVDLHGDDKDRGEWVYSHIKRVFCKNYGIDFNMVDNIDRMTFDTRKINTMGKLTSAILRRAMTRYTLVIIDPIEKVVNINGFRDWIDTTNELVRFEDSLDKATVICVHYTPKNWLGGDPNLVKNVKGHEIQEEVFDTILTMSDLEIPKEVLHQTGLPLNTQGFQINNFSRNRADDEFRVIFKDEFFELDEKGILDDCDFVKKTKHKKSEWID